ncbi:uncharacterized protein BDR25DRAFT_355240 [Lindgomyces ingoldianus]|uniref:Uncharacterized protein n=1 Tax=Lindgomyces ingoldianus TaxID=673940 RepID=A0ACB6QV93_9PLEO|nr:uncharacterized protein BDR25DRAFT_355240 [Lindgomyces ingoldianus]KAF2470771.1 hypothetical protein BDR25DRAFT_355240 [Lindgomyces ingoldianus]
MVFSVTELSKLYYATCWGPELLLALSHMTAINPVPHASGAPPSFTDGYRAGFWQSYSHFKVKGVNFDRLGYNSKTEHEWDNVIPQIALSLLSTISNKNIVDRHLVIHQMPTLLHDVSCHFLQGRDSSCHRLRSSNRVRFPAIRPMPIAFYAQILPYARKRDLLCIIFGTHTRFVIRPSLGQSVITSWWEKHFSGKIKGEIVELFTRGKREKKDIILYYPTIFLQSFTKKMTSTCHCSHYDMAIYRPTLSRNGRMEYSCEGQRGEWCRKREVKDCAEGHTLVDLCLPSLDLHPAFWQDAFNTNAVVLQNPFLYNAASNATMLHHNQNARSPSNTIHPNSTGRG